MGGVFWVGIRRDEEGERMLSSEGFILWVYF